MDIVCRGKAYVNNALADMETKVYDNFTIACEIKKDEPNYQKLMEEYGEGQVPEAVLNGQMQEAEQVAEGYAAGEEQPVSGLQKEPAESLDLPVTVNGDTVILRNKKEYILVDVLDFYPFDLSVAKGNRLEILINGVSSDFTSPVHENDEIKIYWV